jgi:hypothetical protein
MQNHGFTPGQKKALLETVRAEHRRILNTQRRPAIPTTDNTAPEVYAALTPSGGIPAINFEGTGTGSGNCPGSAVCEIYRFLNPTTTCDLLPQKFSKTVHNLGSAIPGHSWILVTRDKYGTWWAVPTAVGGSSTLRYSRASYGLALDVSIPNNTLTPIQWPLSAQNYDTDNYIPSALSSTIHIPFFGYYFFTMQALWESNATGYRQIQVYEDTGFVLADNTVNAVNGTYTAHNCSFISPLAATNLLTVYVYQNSGGPLNLLVGNTLAAEGHTVWSIEEFNH